MSLNLAFPYTGGLRVASPISIGCSDTWEDAFIKLHDILLTFERNE